MISTGLLSCFLFMVGNAQTSLKVYDIFQAKCATSGCHNNADQEAGLDLEGTGATTALKALNVYNNIFNVTPANDHAQAKGYKYIYPGRTDKSFLFRKLNLGLEQTINMHAEEGQSMPPYGGIQLTDVEKEMVRQWILYGAPTTGDVVDEGMIDDYYNVSGQASFPERPQTPEEEGMTGFQIKMGPFYLNKAGQFGDELEYFQKYELELQEDVDVDRIDIKISGYSHHLLIYDFNEGGDTNIPHGLRLNPDHSNIGLVTAVQSPLDMRLPQGTAFKWKNNLVLDLNSHYINYDDNSIYQAEAYINVYTQPAGTAAQEMKSDLLVNPNIPIPNNGNEIVHNHNIIFPALGDIHIWGLMGHTHKYGTGYQVFTRNGFTQGEMIYDGSCAEGVPGCVSPAFDYQHIPIRYFEPFLPATLNFNEGLAHTATYVNNGPSSVNFGVTSDDEMMVLIIMYTEDTTGVIFTGNQAIEMPLDAIQVYPNPASNQFMVDIPVEVVATRFQLFDMMGREIENQMVMEHRFMVSCEELPQGMYLYRVETNEGQFKTGKILLER